MRQKRAYSISKVCLVNNPMWGGCAALAIVKQPLFSYNSLVSFILLGTLICNFLMYTFLPNDTKCFFHLIFFLPLCM